MKVERIKEIQEETAYPDSVSIQQALLKVWNECEQQYTPQPANTAEEDFGPVDFTNEEPDKIIVNRASFGGSTAEERYKEAKAFAWKINELDPNTFDQTLCIAAGLPPNQSNPQNEE